MYKLQWSLIHPFACASFAWVCFVDVDVEILKLDKCYKGKVIWAEIIRCIPKFCSGFCCIWIKHKLLHLPIFSPET